MMDEIGITIKPHTHHVTEVQGALLVTEATFSIPGGRRSEALHLICIYLHEKCPLPRTLLLVTLPDHFSGINLRKFFFSTLLTLSLGLCSHMILHFPTLTVSFLYCNNHSTSSEMTSVMINLICCLSPYLPIIFSFA